MSFLAPAMLMSPLALLAGAAILALAWRMRGQARALDKAIRSRDRAVAAEQAAIRTLRLTAIELRTPAMTLLGYADRLTLAHPAGAGGDLAIHSAAIAGGAMAVLNIADELQDHAVGSPAARVLRPETLVLAPMLRDSIVAIDAMLGPSRRQWRLAPDLAAIRLHADRRALTQILTRVLGNAARLSRDRDWIDIRALPNEDGLTIVIEDEGAGLPACLDMAPGRAAHPASRGFGLGLALARTLMAAHGGALTVESTAQVGSRVMLTFPPGSVVAVREAA